MTKSASVSVTGLTKQYGAVTAVDDISFDIEAGSAVAFVGTNGAENQRPSAVSPL